MTARPLGARALVAATLVLGTTLGCRSADLTSVAVSPSGEIVAAARTDRTVQLWSSRSESLAHELEGHSGFVASLAWSPRGDALATGSVDGTVGLWSVEGRRTGTIDLALGTRAIRIDADGGAISRGPVDRSGCHIASVAFAPSGDELATASTRGVHVWSLAHPDFPRLVDEEAASAVAFSPAGDVLACGAGRTLRLYPTSGGRALRSIAVPPPARVAALAFSPRGDLIATGGGDRFVRVFSTHDGALVRSLEVEGERDAGEWVNAIAFSPRDDLVAAGSHLGHVRIWSVRTGALVRAIERVGHVSAVAFFPGGTPLVSVGKGDNLRLSPVTPKRSSYP